LTVADDSNDDHDRLELEDAIRVERMALDNGSGVDKNMGALAREIRRTQRDVHELRNRI
jgi:hypothetical protein